MKKLRVLIISQHFPPEKSGNASRIYDLSTNLTKLGVSVTVFSPFPSFPHGSYKRSWKFDSERTVDGIKHVRIWNWQPRSSDPSFPTRMGYYLIFPLLSIIKSLLNAKKYDAIITSAPPIFTGFPGFFLKKITGKKWLFDVRDLWLEASASMNFIKKDGLFYKMSKMYEKICYTTCDEILVTTNKVKEIIAETYHISKNKIHIIPNGVDTSIYKPAEEKKNQLIYSGNIGHAQDLEKVVLAVKKINEHTPLDFILVGDGDTRYQLESFVKTNDLSDHVFFTGLVNRKKIPSLINESIIGIAPLKNIDTLSYAIPTKIYEYMACEVPFIGTGKGEIEKITKESQAGLIALNTVDSIYEKINSFLNQPQKRNEMGKKGRDFVGKFYDRKQIAKKLLHLISS